MRTCKLAVPGLALLTALAGTGCYGRDAVDPSEIIAEDVARASAASRTPAGWHGGAGSGAHVTCRCDAEGGLHVAAPEGSQVRVAEGASTEDAAAEITLPDEAPGQPIRRTKSLGFIGDNKLTETPSRGGPWNAPDALLPIHRHGGGSYSFRSSYGYSGYGGSGYSSYGRGYSRGRLR